MVGHKMPLLALGLAVLPIKRSSQTARIETALLVNPHEFFPYPPCLASSETERRLIRAVHAQFVAWSPEPSVLLISTHRDKACYSLRCEARI